MNDIHRSKILDKNINKQVWVKFKGNTMGRIGFLEYGEKKPYKLVMTGCMGCDVEFYKGQVEEFGIAKDHGEFTRISLCDGMGRRYLRRSDLMTLVGSTVQLQFKGSKDIHVGKLEYIPEFSEKYDFSKPNHFRLGNYTFLVSHVYSVQKV